MDKIFQLFSYSMTYLNSFMNEEEIELLNDHKRHMIYSKCVDDHEESFYMATRNKCYDYSNTLYQVSFWNALSSGNYSAVIPLDEILKVTDTGTGALVDMEAAVIIVDGVAYALSLNEVTVIPRSQYLPYCSSFKSKPCVTVNFKAHNYIDFQNRFNDYRMSDNILCGFKIRGHFESVTVYKVKKTTKKLAAGLKDSVTMTIKNVTGVAVGTWVSPFFESISKSGYHLHFINDARNDGGHVMDFTGGTFTVEMQYLNNVHMVLPTYDSYLNCKIDSKNMTGTS